MRSKIGMMSWEHRVVVADGMINGLGYDEIRSKLQAAGVVEDELPSNDSMRTYRDGHEMKSMMMDRIKAQHEHQQAARVADRVNSLIDLSTVQALEGIHRDLAWEGTTLEERLKALRVLVMYRRQLFLERQAGDVKPNQANHVVLESDLENPDHILFEPGSQAAYSDEEVAAAKARKAAKAAATAAHLQGATEEPQATAADGTDESGSVAIDGDESGYVAISGDKSGSMAINGDESGCAGIGGDEVADIDTHFYDQWGDHGDDDDDDDDEGGELISEAEVRTMSDRELDFLAASREFALLLAELRDATELELLAWVDERFPAPEQAGARLLWNRILKRQRGLRDASGAA